MSDLERELRDAATRVTPRWDDERARRVRESMHARKARRAQTRRIGSMAALGVVVLLTLAGSGRLAEAASAIVRFFTTLSIAEPAAAPAAPTTPAPSAASTLGRTGASAAAASEEPPAIVPVAPAEEPPIAPIAAKPHEAPHAAPSTAPAAQRDWRALAREQNFAAAYDAFQSGPRDVRDEAEDLLLASDVARLSKHPSEAIEPLRGVLQKHRTDARAPLAAFTLGRVLLSDLHRPGEAADAFAEARALAPDGALAEDALAREVEAAAAAGDAPRAHARAEEYVTKYPQGTRIATVRRFGNLP